ncbi:hypothetical protein ACIBHX_39350 [Nonomuraea sp. NPDC050536]|uniref:hypothetical protein n=1 Tax=Nonomuraea sp. NPDC050536 TaxID=3364366 RepID=UPI0037C5095E
MARHSLILSAGCLLLAACAPTSALSVAATPTTGPPPRWEIYTSQYGQFAIWHPPGWIVREKHGSHRSIRLTIAPPHVTDQFVLTRKLGAPPSGGRQGNVYCRKVRLSGSFTGKRCLNTISGVLVTTLTGTPQGTFTFQASHRSPAFAQYDKFLSTFTLLRGVG